MPRGQPGPVQGLRVSSQLQDTVSGGQTVGNALLPWGAGGTDPTLRRNLHGENREDDGQAVALHSWGFKYDSGRALKGGKGADEWRGKERVF